MRAMIFDGSVPRLKLQDVPTPSPKEGQVRIAVEACGVCRTDLHVIDDELPDPVLPIVPGHEIVGEVAETGAAVTGLEVGQRIGDYEAFVDYMNTVWAQSESFLERLDPATLGDLIVPRPFPDVVANTYSARVAGADGITRLDAIEGWWYQHGLRHMGEIEHARALVGLEGMTS